MKTMGSLKYDISNYTFSHIWLDQKQLCEEFGGLKESQLYHWQYQWQKSGRDLAEMGKLPKHLSRKNLWDPQKFLIWVTNNQLNKPTEEAHEQHINNKINYALLNNQQRKAI
tara:strand:+ start:614 stop:949 length:336 start_codon:yes stop_codon:yes gene_type:complete